VRYADKDSVSHAGRVLGLTLGAAALDADVSIQTLGPVEDSGWSWSTGSDPTLFVGDNGALVQGTPPAGSFVLPVGFVMSATKAFIRIGTPVFN
jgi:hypothetical protein